MTAEQQAIVDAWIAAGFDERCIVYDGDWWPAYCTQDGPQRYGFYRGNSLADLVAFCAAHT